MNSAGGTFYGSVTASSFSGAGTGLSGLANNLSIGGNAVTASYPQNHFWNLVGVGGNNDPYGTMSVSNPADANNYSYYGLTRNGQIPYGIGINTSNDFMIGIPSPGNSGEISHPIFILTPGGAATFNSSVAATKLITIGGTSSQFMKADGSLDGTTYLPSSNVYGTANNVPVFNTNNSITNSNAIYVSSSNVGIGTATPQSKLAVNGTVTATEVKVTQTGWSDFVFDSAYRLPSLSTTAAYIKSRHHLPDIPSGKEIEKEGTVYPKFRTSS